MSHIGRHDGVMYTNATWVSWTWDYIRWGDSSRAVVPGGGQKGPKR